MRFLLLTTLSLLSLNTYAFTMNNSAKLVFQNDEVTVNVASGNCANIGIGDAEMLAIIGDAVNQYWNQAPTSRLKLRRGTAISVATNFHTDSICNPSTNCVPNPTVAVSSGILISCNDNATNFPSGSILGVTIPNHLSGNKILGSLILINDTAATQFDTKTHNEKVSIIAHELGHAFGLGHSPVEDSLMFYATVTQRRSLGRDDIDGVSYLYPKQQPVGCGTVDFNAGNKPNFWPGLFIGFSIICLAELYRKRKQNSFKLS